MQHDAIIVGGGLFGSVIAAQLRSQGRSVLVLDSNEKGAGSKPAACLMKPSWFSSMGKDKFEPSLELLDRLYGVHDVHFKIKRSPLGATVHWCNPASILSGGYTPAKVFSIAQTLSGWAVGYTPLGETGHVSATTPLLVVAAGIWSKQLIGFEEKMQGQAGMAFLFEGVKLTEPFIDAYAPYRQLVAFNRGDGVWVGDGTAIKQENWSEDRENSSFARCVNAISPIHSSVKTRRLYGVRPYVKDAKPCLLRELNPGLWVATGGAKNGTIAAGWCAHEISRRTA
jgi:glycine/D-amino acid oxidase-like deaminating enzyme